MKFIDGPYFINNSCFRVTCRYSADVAFSGDQVPHWAWDLKIITRKPFLFSYNWCRGWDLNPLSMEESPEISLFLISLKKKL